MEVNKMFKREAIELLKDYFGFTTKEAEEYYNKASQCGEIDDIVKEIKAYKRIQATESFYND
jgi:hypothetical protein